MAHTDYPMDKINFVRTGPGTLAGRYLRRHQRSAMIGNLMKIDIAARQFYLLLLASD